MIFAIVLMLIFCVGMSANVTGSNSEDYYGNLKQDMFKNNRIDTRKRPVTQYTDAVTIDSTLVILHIYKLDEETGTLSVNGWIELYWHDPQLQWDPTNYGGISYIEASDVDVWKPDITVLNSVQYSMSDFYKAVVHVHSNGRVSWMPAFVSRTSCPIDHRYFPFDEHVCNIDLGSWNYDNKSLKIRIYRSGLSEDDTIQQFFVVNPLWTKVESSVDHVNVTYSCCPNAMYQFIRHTLRLRRNSPLYKFLFILPSVMSIILTLTLFWMPPSAGEKFTLGGIVVVMQLGLLIALGFTIPAGGKTVPHIVLLCGNSLVMTCLSLVISVLVIRLSRGHSYTPLPSLIKNALNGPFGRILCFGHTSGSREDKTTIMDEDKPESDCVERNQNAEAEVGSAKPSAFGDWILLATAIDHLCFILYSIIFALILIGSFA